MHNHVLTEQLEDCRSDLEEFGVHFEVWFSEKSLFDTGLVARCVDQLERPATCTNRTAPSGSSTAFGDEGPRRAARQRPLHLLRLRTSPTT